VVALDGRIVVYTEDDERFEYYKFVSSGRYDPNNHAANFGLLDDGTLCAAKFSDDGTSQWLPIVFGQSALVPPNFNSQADVLIKARFAADGVGATKMDRPEDIETNPVNGNVHCVMTNN
jgi:secreted PhoX family phosphatase